MATREENLQKINDELEMMSDEELDQVAGGTFEETAEDSQLLYKHGFLDSWYDAFFSLPLRWITFSKEVDKGWAKAGITCCTSPVGANKYWRNGKQISREDALLYAESKFKRIRHEL